MMSLPANIEDYELNLFASADEMKAKNLPEPVKIGRAHV